MKLKHTLALSVVTKPIQQPVTKFGGQPVWLEAPQWPYSPTFGKPMRFMGQVALDPLLFGGEPGRVAYFFFTDLDLLADLTEEDDVTGPDDPFGGENAVIIQPGGRPLHVDADLRPEATGPTLVRYTFGKNGRTGLPVKQEYAVRLTPGRDPDEFIPVAVKDEDFQELKIGGTPVFISPEEYPELAGWAGLLQLDCGQVPFDPGFPPSTIIYALLSPDGLTGALFTQDPFYYDLDEEDEDEEAAEDPLAETPAAGAAPKGAE